MDYSAFQNRLTPTLTINGEGVTTPLIELYKWIIHLFKTNRELALATLKKYARLTDLSVMESLYDEYSQRLIRPAPYPTLEGIQTIIDHLAKTRPQAKALNASDFIDPSILKEIEDSGFVKRLYGT